MTANAAIRDSSNKYNDIAHRFTISKTVNSANIKQSSVTLTAGEINHKIDFESIAKPNCVIIIGEHPLAIDTVTSSAGSPGTSTDAYIRCREFFLVNTSSATQGNGLYLNNLEKNQTNTVTILLAGSIT